jgi:plasmid stability protein
VSLDLRPVQVRLPDDAYEALDMLASANGHDLGEEAREILTEVLLGKAHAIKLLHARLSRAVKTDKVR